MEETYYSVENCHELSSSITEFVDTFKYLLNLPRNHPDSMYLTEELFEAFDSVAGSAEEMLNSYKYYKEAKHYLAKDEAELEAMIFSDSKK